MIMDISGSLELMPQSLDTPCKSTRTVAGLGREFHDSTAFLKKEQIRLVRKMKSSSTPRNTMSVAKVPVVLLALLSAIVNPDPFRQSRGLHASNSMVGSTLGEVKEISIENAIGVIALNKKTYNRERRIQIFNDDGSLWYEFSFYDADPDRQVGQANADFQPFAFHPDYFVLALKCVGKDATRFKVVVNETTGLAKFIRRSDQALKFQTWREHILDLFAVGFDPSKNPLRIAPTERAKAIRLRADVIYHPLQMNGRWLKVSWSISGEQNDKGKKISYGWVKWKENNRLLLDLFYFS
jgi:hypothetical protein